MSARSVPIEELLARGRGREELFDAGVDVDALGERTAGVYDEPVAERDALAGDGEPEEADGPARAEAEVGGGSLEFYDVSIEGAEDDADPDDDLGDGAEDRPAKVMAPSRSEQPFDPHHVYDEAGAFKAASERLKGFVRHMARRIANGDAHLEEDLVQEAQIELWELDPSRFDETDQMYVKRALVRRMIDAVEREFVKGTGVPRTRLRQHVQRAKHT